MVVSAVMSIEQDILPLEMIGIKKVPGGALEESRLVHGVAFKKTFSYAGFEMQEKQKVIYSLYSGLLMVCLGGSFHCITECRIRIKG